jgi:hypothetical protein
METRTGNQNRALWLFYELLADELNNAGLDQRKVLKETIEIPWTKQSIHDQLWIPIQKAMFSTESTTALSKSQEIDRVHEVLMRHLGEKFHIEYIPFPNDPGKENIKLQAMDNLKNENYPEYQEAPEF